jgi:dihydroorotate dehydrogenase
MMPELYELAWRPVAELIGRTDAMTAHARTVSLMRGADGLGALVPPARLAARTAFPDRPARVGGVDLPYPAIVAAGLVKGDGFATEDEALAAVRAGHDVVPGWRSAPALVGPVEFGSYTRHPRLGNSGRVLWRDSRAGWMQNRVGLRNPGARAAAAFLARHAAELPPVWGLNLAVSPGQADLGASRGQVGEAARIFGEAFAGLQAGPSWLTLNLSCPNTEDDPRGVQSADLAQALCAALWEVGLAPLWVKIGPDLSDAQLGGLVKVFMETGVQAVIATNTWAQPLPEGEGSAGVSGTRLRPLALDTVRRLGALVAGAGGGLDIVGGGGILEGRDLLAFRAAGARAAMLYSALVFRGPLAGALILREAEAGGRHA